MNIRIQTHSQSNNNASLPCRLLINSVSGGTVYEALEKGFNDLADLCDVVTDKFTAARDAFPRGE